MCDDLSTVLAVIETPLLDHRLAAAVSSEPTDFLLFIFSIATAIGCIALAGVAAEFGVVMLLYMKHALAAQGDKRDEATVLLAVRDGVVLHVRPKAMTVAVIVAGLVPIMSGHGSGSEVISRLAAPLVGDRVSAPLLSLFVLSAACLMYGA